MSRMMRNQRRSLALEGEMSLSLMCVISCVEMSNGSANNNKDDEGFAANEGGDNKVCEYRTRREEREKRRIK